ncbi:hypothetical protein TWF718_001169 [Orbilia javanica]|uniref:Uncharacterized protein n=1 Tax=Orbilia javanica TaxID=47235 RepID=A0AAN8NDH0_9PEZI
MGHHHSEDDSGNESTGSGHHQHDAKLSHELLAGAAAFAAFREFQKHQREQGRPVSHALAKELLAAFAAAQADKLIETRGVEKWEEYREKAREEAREKSKEMYQDRYEHEDGEGEEHRHRHRHHLLHRREASD